jgi:hypothetical protein
MEGQHLKVVRGIAMVMSLSLLLPVATAQTAVDSTVDARAAIKAIWDAAQVYYQDRGEWPPSVDVLLEEKTRRKAERGENPDSLPTYDYVKIPRDVSKEWTFRFDYGGPPSMIRATSRTDTYEFEGDAYPLRIDYSIMDGRWSGNGIPDYEKDTLTAVQKAELMEDAKSAVREIWEAAKVYYYDKGVWPVNVAELERNHYIAMRFSTFLQWDINLTGTPPRAVTAISTQWMPGGAGRTFSYDGKTETFQGYGVGE